VLSARDARPGHYRAGNGAFRARGTFAPSIGSVAGVSEAIAQQRDLRALFHDLATRLHSVVEFDFLTLILHDPVKNVMRLHILETDHLTDGRWQDHPVDTHPSDGVQQQEPLVVSDTHEETRFPELHGLAAREGRARVCAGALTTAQRRVGAMGFGAHGA